MLRTALCFWLYQCKLLADTRHIFYSKKHAMTVLLYGKTNSESHENSYWFLKIVPILSRSPIFYWKLLYSNNASIKKNKNLKCSTKSLYYLQKKFLVMRIGGKMQYLQPITWFNDYFCARPKFIKNS
jgi:hypothetical protein